MDDEPTQKPYPSPGESAPSGPPPTRRSESAPPRRHSPSGPLSRDDSLDYDDEDHPRRRGGYSGPPRRDSEPHRGVLIMVLGIISLAAVFLSFCYGVGTLVGIPLGITAWVLGHGDLRKIKNREMDEEGLGMTQAGWICGIIGVILHSLVLLTCGAFFAYFLISLNANSPSTKPAFAVPPPAPAPMVKDRMMDK